MTDSRARAADLRAQFPIFRRISYLNAGSVGPVPQASIDAARRASESLAQRGGTELELWMEFRSAAEQLRASYAAVLGCDDDEVSLTASTTDGIHLVLTGLDLRPGDELLTTKEEHVGLRAPLAAAVRRTGTEVRAVDFDALPAEVTSRTRLVACSHVSCISGKIMDTSALSQSGVPVLLDGAQALGAIPVDVRSLGCDFYAASGQKWLCGAEGTGCLFVKADAMPSLHVTRPGYFSFTDPWSVEPELRTGSRRFDTVGQGVLIAWSLAAIDLLESAGWEWIFERSHRLAEQLVDLLSNAGARVAPRGLSTLVGWASQEPDVLVQRLASEGLQIRSLPNRGLVRASIGAWSSEDELDRLVGLVSRR